VFRNQIAGVLNLAGKGAVRPRLRRGLIDNHPGVWLCAHNTARSRFPAARPWELFTSPAMLYDRVMHGHPLLAALLGQLESLERSARELRAPLLAGQAEALRQSVIAVVGERAGLEEAAVQAALKAKKLELAIEESKRRYEESLRSFDRFRQGFELVDALRDLGDLPALLERLRALFKVDMIRLVLDEAEYGKYLPPDAPVLRGEALEELARAIRAAGTGSYVGPARHAPPGVLTEAEARRFGSLFAFPLADRFTPERANGLLVVADRNPGRYRPEMATDYMEHFGDTLAGAVASVAGHRKAEELREDVERITRHDLKSPLSAILTLPQFLLEADNLTGRQREMIRLMLESGRRMQSMITLSLSLYRMERGVYALSPEPLDMARLTRAIWEESGGPYRSARMELAIEAEADPFMAMGEELLCYTMLANLIKNALEASKPGERVTVRLKREPGFAVVEVANAADVPEQMRHCFFEKYATCGKQAGTGLGAYTARLIARTHGGEAEMETAKGEGTVVRVRLPGAGEQ
jgi:signal transduction histidine kinase